MQLTSRSQHSERESCLCAQLTSRSQHSERESCLCAQLTSRKPELRVRERKLSVCTTHIKEASAQSGKAVLVLLKVLDAQPLQHHQHHRRQLAWPYKTAPPGNKVMQLKHQSCQTACLAVQDGITWEQSNACLNTCLVRELAWLYKTASPGNKIMHA